MVGWWDGGTLKWGEERIRRGRQKKNESWSEKYVPVFPCFRVPKYMPYTIHRTVPSLRAVHRHRHRQT